MQFLAKEREMLKVSLLEFVIRGIPEGLILFLAIYAFTKNKIQLNRYLISSIVLSICVYFIKMLPIQKGADSILNLIVLIVLSVYINNLPVITAIKTSIFIMLLEFICEGINIFIIQSIFKKDLNTIFENASLTIIYTMPSLIIFGCIVVMYYIRLYKRKELKDI